MINIIVMQDFNLGPECFKKGDIIYTGDDIPLDKTYTYVNGRFRAEIPMDILQVVKFEEKKYGNNTRRPKNKRSVS